MSLPETSPPYGAFFPGRMGRMFLSLTRSCGTSWPARKTRILLRRLARPWLPLAVDTEVFGCKVRLHRTGNICERSALFGPRAFDPREREALQAVGQPAAVFVDVGANVGLYSLSLARAWSGHEGARVLSIEPHPTIRARLLFNLAQNPGLPVEVSDVAVTASAGPVTLRTGTTNLGETRVSEEGDVTVPGTTLLAELERRGIHRVDALKVDVEGAEDRVITPFLRAAPEELIPRVMVVEDNTESWKEDLLGWIGRRGLVLRERTRNNLIFARSSQENGRRST